jgi:hypothetical protein
LLNTKSDPTVAESHIEELNVTKLASQFAAIEYTINVFLFGACRTKDAPEERKMDDP